MPDDTETGEGLQVLAFEPARRGCTSIVGHAFAGGRATSEHQVTKYGQIEMVGREDTSLT